VIVKKIIEEHGGVVSIANLPGGGARVTATLPVPSGGEKTTTETAVQARV
jgi:signal transduction histidine kinase